MRRKYSRFVGDALEDLDLQALLSKLSDLLLNSGFEDPYWTEAGEDDSEHTLQALHDAILDALLRGELLPEDTLRDLLGDEDDEQARAALEELVRQIIERLQREGYITAPPDLESHRERRSEQPADQGHAAASRFEITDKSLDFLGYRALRDLLGSVGRGTFGRHDTRDLSTGIESSGASKPYEYGDTLNLDPSGTILNAVQRAGVSSRHGTGPFIDVQSEDLMVAQSEYQASCATVLMLDCSHSMILYGEDRFTPAKRVALALANLIRTQYPGDALHLVLFHDSAEEIPITRLARVRVGPYYTNTREGLRLARRILERQRKDMRQIVMITDGKPSALTQPDGRIYRNAFGLDPFIVAETFSEVARCRKAGILINTFMLARDYDLVSFVRRVSRICRGKAYFTTPRTLGRYVLLDYLNRKTRTVH